MQPRSTSRMRTGPRSVRLLAASIAGLAMALGSPALARQEAKPAAIQTLLVMERADLSQLLVDPKDQRLKEALAMLPMRLQELPAEAPDMDAKGAAAINLLLSTISRPGRVGITVNAGNPADGLFGYGLVVSAFAKDRKDADELHSRVRDALKDIPLPPPPGGTKRFATMEDTQLPGGIGRLSFGPRETPDGWRYEIIAGALDNPDAAWSQIPRPSDAAIKPVVIGRVDFAGLNNAVNMVSAFAGPQNPDIGEGIRQAGEYGLYGTNALKVRFEYGYSKEESVGHVAIENAAKYADKFLLSKESLTEADYGAVPGDATMATISRADLAMLRRVIDAARQSNPEIGPGLEQFKQMTGVDLVTDIVDTLGGTIAYYTSDSTGGGGIGSVVGMVTVKDRAKFAAAHEKLVAFANSAATTAKDAGKYARVVAWKEAGIPLMSLRFAGLPVPVEVSYSLTDRWLIAGVTPQAVVAAVRQTASEGKGLLAKSRVAELAQAHKLVSVTYLNTARMMHSGYPIASMVGSAAANAARSPAFLSDAGRDPGMVTPTFADLARDARDSVWTTRWDGEAYLIDSHADRSMLVGVAGYSGTLMQLTLPIGLAAAAADAGKHSHDHDGDAMDEPDGDNDDQSMRPIFRTDPGLAIALASRDPVMGMALWGGAANRLVRR